MKDAAVTTLAWTYAVYLAASGLVTITVGHTLHRHGRAFLIDVFGDTARVADAVNHLLLIGFYLMNFVFVTLTLKSGPEPADVVSAAELLSGKLGVVLMTLGVMHFFNLAVLTAVRRRALRFSRSLAQGWPVSTKGGRRVIARHERSAKPVRTGSGG